MAAGNRAREVAAALEGLPAAIDQAADASLLAVGEAARNIAVDRTRDRYNLTADTIREYIDVRRVGQSKGGAVNVQLKIRALPIEAFGPEVRMRRFRWTDKLGRVHDRLLPAVYFQRLRGGSARFLRPAFPLVQRESGQLRSGESIRRRTGSERGKLTRIRYFTFPRAFVTKELLPAIRERALGAFGIEFSTAFRRFTPRFRRELRNN